MATVQSEGAYRRNSANDGWVDYNDNNEIYIRNSANDGWNNGSKYPDGVIFRRNSSDNGWEQIYPLGIITDDSDPITTTSAKMSTKQKSYPNWKDGSSRQGWCIKDGAGGEQFGIISCPGSNVPGSGSIISVGTMYFSGTLGAAGNYNATQTISFRGTKFASLGSGDPFGTHDPSSPFTFSWRAGGAGSDIPKDTINVSDSKKTTALNWMNNVSSYGKQLCTYNGETSSSVGSSYESTYSNNYLNITKFVLELKGYKYEASRMLLSRPSNKAKMFSMSSVASVPKDENYLDIAVPRGMEFSDSGDIINMIENEDIKYVNGGNMESFKSFDYKPVIYSVENNRVRTSPIFDMDVCVEYKHGEVWSKALNLTPREYIIRDGSTEVALVNSKTGEAYYHLYL